MRRMFTLPPFLDARRETIKILFPVTVLADRVLPQRPPGEKFLRGLRPSTPQCYRKAQGWGQGRRKINAKTECHSSGAVHTAQGDRTCSSVSLLPNDRCLLCTLKSIHTEHAKTRRQDRSQMPFKRGLGRWWRPPRWVRARFARTEIEGVSVRSTAWCASAAAPGWGNALVFGFL